MDETRKREERAASHPAPKTNSVPHMLFRRVEAGKLVMTQLQTDRGGVCLEVSVQDKAVHALGVNK
jgi:hypothetical protein